VSNDHNVVTRLLPVVSRRYAVHVLDALAEKPRTYGELRASLHAPRRHLDRAIHTLAAQGAIQRTGHPGSWDGRAPAATRYALTTTGHHLARQLARLEIWTAIYEYYLHD
jgi:DNA-binding HxlR family transcriptional regulator